MAEKMLRENGFNFSGRGELLVCSDVFGSEAQNFLRASTKNRAQTVLLTSRVFSDSEISNSQKRMAACTALAAGVSDKAGSPMPVIVLHFGVRGVNEDPGLARKQISDLQPTDCSDPDKLPSHGSLFKLHSKFARSARLALDPERNCYGLSFVEIYVKKEVETQITRDIERRRAERRQKQLAGQGTIRYD